MAKLTAAQLTIYYLALPVVIFLLGWFAWYISVPAVALCLFMLFGDYKSQARTFGVANPEQHKQRTPLLFGVCNSELCLIACAFVWAYLAGVGGFRPQHFDYYKHNLIFANLVTNPWPVQYADGQYLCYYLAYYLPASALAKLWCGVEVVGYYSFLWAWLGLSLLFVQLFRIGGWRFVLLFCFFNSIEAILLVYEALKSPLTISQSLADLWTNDHTIELIFTPGGLVFPSHVESITAVPQHAIGGWLAVVVLIQKLKNQLTLKPYSLLLIAVLLLYWSPFVAVGFLVFVVVPQKPLRNVGPPQPLPIGGGEQSSLFQNIILRILPSPYGEGLGVGLIALPAITYYLGHTPLYDTKGWWLSYINSPHQYVLFIVFFVVEILVWFGLILFLERKHKTLKANKLYFFVALIVLSFLTLYRYGFYNDLARRSSLPATMILCWVVSEFLVQKQNVKILWLVVAVGAVIPLKHHIKWLSARPYTAEVSLSPSDMKQQSIHFLKYVHDGEFDVVAQYLGQQKSFYWQHCRGSYEPFLQKK